MIRLDAKVGDDWIMDVNDPKDYAGQASGFRRVFAVTAGRMYQYLTVFSWGERISRVMVPKDNAEWNQVNTVAYADSPLEVHLWDMTPPA